MTARNREQKLAQLLEKHAGWERRTLADIRNLGYGFTSLAAAQQHLKARATLARMTPDELTEFVVKNSPRAGRRTA